VATCGNRGGRALSTNGSPSPTVCDSEWSPRNPGLHSRATRRWSPVQRLRTACP
jgi:hypothetical protein